MAGTQGPRDLPFPTPAPHFLRSKIPARRFLLPAGGGVHSGKPLSHRRVASAKLHHHTCHRSRKSEERGRAPPPTSNKPLGALSLPGRQPLRTAASAPGPQIIEPHVTRVTSLCCGRQAQGQPASTWPSGSGSPVHQHFLQGSLGPRGAEHPGVPLPAVHLPGQREARACRPQAEIKADVREANYPETAADC